MTGVTHNHPEGLKGARAVSAAIFLLRAGTPMLKVWKHVVEACYPLDFTLDEIRPDYAFDVSCQGSVPQALKAFFEADGFECVIRMTFPRKVRIGARAESASRLSKSGTLSAKCKNRARFFLIFDLIFAIMSSVTATHRTYTRTSHSLEGNT